MKFFISIILTALLSFAGALFLPWWIIAVAGFLVAFLIHQKGFYAFLSAFIAVFLLWGVQAFLIDTTNNHILATKVAAILPLGGSYTALIYLSALIGALVAGMGALTGSQARRLFTSRKTGIERSSRTV